MVAKSTRSLAELLSTGSLKELANQAQEHRDLTARIRALLPAEEASHLVSASTNSAGELELTMDASVWAARVRYQAQSLGKDRIRVKVRPTPSPEGSDDSVG